MSDEEKEKEKKKKCPTAIKRMKQNKASNIRNNSFKSRVRTVVRSFETALTAKDTEKVQVALKAFYSLMDKGVKHGIYKENKAARAKSRMANLQKTA